MVRKRVTISYTASSQPDLDGLLNRLKASKDSPYWNRSLSDIGGMILAEAAQREVDRYCKTDRRRSTAKGDLHG